MSHLTVHVPGSESEPIFTTPDIDSSQQEAKDSPNRSSYPEHKRYKKDIDAARALKRAWFSFRDRQMFLLLKHTIRAAEAGVGYEILRKISPNEAELIRDPSSSFKIRFRFAGTEFPPYVVFKIYSEGSTKYVAGKTAFVGDKQASTDALKNMGRRNFMDQMIIDSCQYHRYRIYDPLDVCSLKDFRQYQSVVDELPARLGGRSNAWRRLNLEDIPRSSIMYDVIDYVYMGKGKRHPSKELLKELPTLMSRVANKDDHVRIISETRAPPQTPASVYHSARFLPNTPVATSRNSVAARKRASIMRSAYLQSRGTASRVSEAAIDDEEEQFFEAEDLYKWSQSLQVDEVT